MLRSNAIKAPDKHTTETCSIARRAGLITSCKRRDTFLLACSFHFVRRIGEVEQLGVERKWHNSPFEQVSTESTFDNFTSANRASFKQSNRNPVLVIYLRPIHPDLWRVDDGRDLHWQHGPLSKLLLLLLQNSPLPCYSKTPSVAFAPVGDRFKRSICKVFNWFDLQKFLTGFKSCLSIIDGKW